MNQHTLKIWFSVVSVIASRRISRDETRLKLPVF